MTPPIVGRTIKLVSTLLALVLAGSLALVLSFRVVPRWNWYQETEYAIFGVSTGVTALALWLLAAAALTRRVGLYIAALLSFFLGLAGQLVVFVAYSVT